MKFPISASDYSQKVSLPFIDIIQGFYKTMTTDVLERICRVLGCDVGDIMKLKI